MGHISRFGRGKGLLALASAAFALASPAQGASAPARIEIVTEELPPYNFTENGVITGSSTEVVRAVLLELGIEAKIVALPWARAMNEAETKPNVLIYTIATTPERAPLFKWVGEINTSKVVVYCLKAHPIEVHSLEDAKKYRLGAIFQDFRYGYLLRRGFVEGKNLESTNSQDLNYAKLKAGRIDLWPMDVAVMGYYVRHAGDDPADTVMPVLDMPELDAETHFSMAFGKKTSDELVEQFRRGLQKIKDDGTYDAILKKWHH